MCLSAWSPFQRRGVALVRLEDPNLDDVVGPDTDELTVEGGVVQLTERETILDPRLAVWLRVWNDVGGVEQLLVAETAQGALLPVGAQHSFAERTLVEPYLELARDVAPSLVPPLAPEIVGSHNTVLGPLEHARIIESDAES